MNNTDLTLYEINRREMAKDIIELWDRLPKTSPFEMCLNLGLNPLELLPLSEWKMGVK